MTTRWSPASRTEVLEDWDGADAPGGASEGQSPALRAPDAVPRSGAALD